MFWSLTHTRARKDRWGKKAKAKPHSPLMFKCRSSSDVKEDGNHEDIACKGILSEVVKELERLLCGIETLETRLLEEWICLIPRGTGSPEAIFSKSLKCSTLGYWPIAVPVLWVLIRFGYEDKDSLCGLPSPRTKYFS